MGQDGEMRYIEELILVVEKAQKVILVECEKELFLFHFNIGNIALVLKAKSSSWMTYNGLKNEISIILKEENGNTVEDWSFYKNEDLGVCLQTLMKLHEKSDRNTPSLTEILDPDQNK
jgi:hypothetical protein